MIVVQEVRAGQSFDVLLSNVSTVQREFTEGVLVTYESHTPMSLLSLSPETSKDICAFLNIYGSFHNSLDAHGPEHPEDDEAEPWGTPLQEGSSAPEDGTVNTQSAITEEGTAPAGAPYDLAPEMDHLRPAWHELVYMSHIASA